MQAPLRIERVGERQQVVLVGAAAVMQHEQATRLARRRALAEYRCAHRAKPIAPRRLNFRSICGSGGETAQLRTSGSEANAATSSAVRSGWSIATNV